MLGDMPGWLVTRGPGAGAESHYCSWDCLGTVAAHTAAQDQGPPAA